MRSPEDMMAAVTGSMTARTGRTLDEGVALVEAEGPDPLDQLNVRRWLKDVHGVPQNTQWAIAFEAATRAGWERPSVQGYVEQQYAGPKKGLRPIYDAVAAAATELGDDVTIEGRGTYTPFVRGRQFAAVAASTKERVDLGLRFTDPPESARLTPAKSPGQSTHKIALREPADVDDEVRGLLRMAYDQNP